MRQRKKQQHRTPRWAAYSVSQHATVIGPPCRPPSREARQIAASPHLRAMPAGLWHCSDWAASALARCTPHVSEAIHPASGATFRLLSHPDGPILALSPEDDAAWRLLGQFAADPTGWANAQQWHRQEATPTEPPTPAGRTITLDPAQCAELGIDPADTAIDLPPNFERLSPEQRKAWARQQMEQIAMEIFEDAAQIAGNRATPAQGAAYLQGIQPGLDAALEGSTDRRADPQG